MLTELRTFIAVVRYGSFARAGEQIGLTQGAVSGQIQRLEEQIGVALFDRTGRRAVLTSMGREVHARAEDILAAVTQLGELPHTEDTRGTLVIGAITSAQHAWLMDALCLFRREFPGITVRVLPGASLNILGQVDSGEIDMAVMIRPPYVLPPEVHWHALLREPFLVLVPAAYEGGDWQEAITQLPFIRYDRSSFGGRSIDLFLRKRQLMVHDALELDEVGGLIRAVEKGVGAAIVPATAACIPFSSQVRVLPMGPDTLFREIGIAERSVHKQPEVTNRLISLMQACAVAEFEAGLPYLNSLGYRPMAAPKGDGSGSVPP